MSSKKGSAPTEPLELMSIPGRTLKNSSVYFDVYIIIYIQIFVKSFSKIPPTNYRVFSL